MVTRNENIVIRDIHESCFLIDISDKYRGDKCSIYEINETGEFIWKEIGTGNEIECIVNDLIDAIVDKVEYDIVLADVKNYIYELREKGFVEVT